jgi:hypothetical protein
MVHCAQYITYLSWALGHKNLIGKPVERQGHKARGSKAISLL